MAGALAWIYRDTDVITLDQLGQDFLRPEKIRVQLNDLTVRKSPIDIGSLAYRCRDRAQAHQAGLGNRVVESSLIISRRRFITNILDSLVGLRDQSIKLFLSHVERIIIWLNDAGYEEIFASSEAAAVAYVSFTDKLYASVLSGEITPQYANGNQRVFQEIVRWQCPDGYEYVLSRAPVLPASRNLVRPPSESDFERFKNVTLTLARTIKKFLMDGEDYPCVLRFSDYEVVRFPSTVGVNGPFRRGAACYNFAALRVATLNEYVGALERSGKRVIRSDAQCSLKTVERNFENSNSDKRSPDRMGMAALAFKAYISLFGMITAASPSEMQQLEYSQSLEVENSVLKKEFTAVKFRASGRLTRYVIGRKSGLPILRELLELRGWILDGQRCEKLFFSFNFLNPDEKPRLKITPAVITNQLASFYGSIAGVYLDPAVPNLTSRKIRKFKSNVGHSAGFSPSIVADVMNHTERVNFSAYSEATIDQQKTELSKYWTVVKAAATAVRDPNSAFAQRERSTAVGHCSGFEDPQPLLIVTDAPILPNCRVQQGCLYCEHYTCHADDEDIHKLYSLAYVIDSIRKKAPDSGYVESLYKDLSIRINYILDAIQKRSESSRSAVERIKESVYNYGILTPFWELRLQRFESLGVVF